LIEISRDLFLRDQDTCVSRQEETCAILPKLYSTPRRTQTSTVWVPVQDEGRSRLTAIWIDRAMTAFTSDGTGAAATCTAEHQEEDVDLLTGEDPPSILSRRS
jgi:hypothetical protein